MGVIDGLSKARMLAIEAASVVGGSISSGHLILTKFDGSTIDAGNVLGPAASINSGAPGTPSTGQIFFDSANFTGLTDLMAAKNPSTSVANWLAYGFGYDTGCTFSVAGGGVTLTGTTAGNHFAGIALTGLSPGESYFAQIKVRVPTGSPDVQFTVGYKTSGHVMKIKDQDVTLALAFTADATSASFGVEFPGTGTVVVKSMKVWVLNQRGYPAYIYDGTGWIETVHMAQKGDIYSRVNTFGDQTITGIKSFTNQTNLRGLPVIGDGTNDAWAVLEGPPAKNRGIMGRTNGSARWGIYVDNEAEAGSNTGSDLRITRYDDAAAPIDTPFWIDRASGLIFLNNDAYVPARYAFQSRDTQTSFAAASAPGLHTVTSAQTDGPITGTYFMCQTTLYQSETVWSQQEAWSPFGSATGPDNRRWMRQMYGGSGNIWGPWMRIDKDAPPEAWTSVLGGVGFANGWVNYGSTYAGAQFRKVGDMVQCRGLVKSGTVATNIFVLPAGYRPPYEHIFACVTNAVPTWATGAASAGTAHTHSQALPAGISGRINVSPSGAVVLSVGANGYASLDNIQFSLTT